jgi:choline dehydrogenase-like flavoprotein
VLIDGHTIRKPEALTAELCVVGAGAAGLALALELAESPIRVLVLEQGGATQAGGGEGLYRIVGQPRPRLVRDRNRAWFVGGSTNYWSGNCRPLDQSDFTCRDWMPGSGWPIDRARLVPFYERAQALCGLGDFRLYELDACRPHLLHPPLDVPSSILVPRVVQACPEPRLAVLHRQRLREATNVQVVTGARVSQLETNARGDAVTSVHGTLADGRRFRVAARAFAVATGSIENARLLLGSRNGHPEGLGNRHDLVGRFFMEHVHVDLPVGAWSEGRDLHFHFDRQPVETAAVWGQLVLSEDVTRAERVPGLALWFQPASPRWLAAATVMRLKRLLHGRTWPETPLQDLRAMLAAPAEMLRLASHRSGRGAGAGRADAFTVRVQPEQMPSSANRLLLSRTRDTAGQRLAELRLSWTEREEQDHARSLRIAADAIGLDGRRLATTMQAMLRSRQVGYFWHHSGSTRMGEDARQGVVDSDCRVHDVSNLFVAGSSVFPTAGTAAPTLTIVALAVRLATHLRDRYA